MGQVTPNMGIYIPAAGETNYDAPFAAGMINIDQHDHSGAPNKGVPISGSGIAAGSITYDKLNANVVATSGTGLGTLGGDLANQITTVGLINSIAGLSSPVGLLAANGATATAVTITGTPNQITVTNGNGSSGNPTIAFPAQTQNSTQSRFLATLTSSVTNATGDGTPYQVICNNVLFDNSSNYNSSTGVFTAPVTGQYLFLAQVNLQNILAGNTANNVIQIITTSATYQVYLGDIFSYSDTTGNLSVEINQIANMSAGDTAILIILVAGGAKVTTVHGQSSPIETQFSGTLLV